MANPQKFLYKIFSKAEKGLSKLNKHLLRKIDRQYPIVEQWYKEDPHSLKRSTFDHLNSNSIVFDLGGYEGQWTSDIYSRYRCSVYVFEPVKQFYSLISERFKENSDIKVFRFGLGNNETMLTISVNEFASSVIKSFDGCISEEIQIKKFKSFIEDHKIQTIDLIKINIEGSEYELLQHIIDIEFIAHIKGLLVQFHNFEESSEIKMKNLKNALSKTHEPVFQYEFVWEYWILKSSY